MKPSVNDKPVQFSIDDGPTFFADEISIMDNQHKFFLDFKNQTPRMDARANEALPIAVKHSSIILDPGLAKVFATLLADHIKKYEENYGKIPDIPVTKNGPVVPTITHTKDDRPSYLG